MPKMPPKWSFGLWLGKISYRSADEVLQVASRLREEKIPCDVIHIDTDWFAENWVCDWQFDKDRFPDVSGMIENLHEEGFKISLWQLPYIERGNISTEVYDEGLAKGYFASLPNGDMKYPHGLIDFSNPEAVHWYKNKLLRPLLEQGIDVIKVDFGESAPAEFKYAGISGSEMHNLYSLLYNKAAYEATLDVKGEENAMIWARSAWAGSQRYPMHWGGDAGTDYSSLASSLQGCLSLSVSGMPFWSSDVGGFWFMPSPDLYVRWVQFGVFCSHMRLHGFYTREPWDFGEEALGIVRKYINLRYQLLPYIFRQALDTTKTGVLFHRPMAYDYPQDPTTASIDTQYMFGESLLVAPIVNEDGICEIYLPQGLWTDFFTEEQIEGPVWLKRTYKLEEFPVFVKENSVIPMDIVHQCIDESHKSEKTLHIYFANTTQRIEYQDESFDITVSSHSDCCIKIDVSGDFDTLELVVHGITAKNIKSNQASVPFENRDSLIQLKMTNNTPSIIIETENEEA
jgi:alpha-D-xyloside xylohydrolase